MIKDKNSIASLAKNFHLEHRGNCAQSIFYAYSKMHGKTDEVIQEGIKSFLPFGAGRAPEGCCGALYAAKLLAPSHADAITHFFKERASNFTTCKEIRPQKIIPCNRCIEIAGEALDLLTSHS